VKQNVTDIILKTKTNHITLSQMDRTPWLEIY